MMLTKIWTPQRYCGQCNRVISTQHNYMEMMWNLKYSLWCIDILLSRKKLPLLFHMVVQRHLRHLLHFKNHLSVIHQHQEKFEIDLEKDNSAKTSENVGQVELLHHTHWNEDKGWVDEVTTEHYASENDRGKNGHEKSSSKSKHKFGVSK
ncbi:Uncharacterized protein Fot_14678 [Forsythia ovata]|uniref:Uncharacterized protein n=1 Tax=Forsythia ovata TaxID=205694 RepID=A0ABD1W702_9LAMI